MKKTFCVAVFVAVSMFVTAVCFGAAAPKQVNAPVVTKKPLPTFTSVPPGPLVPLPRPMIQVSTGFRHACAISATNNLWCWGRNLSGELGIGESAPGHYKVLLPVPVGTAADKYISVAAGGFHTCAVKGDRSLWCWGDNRYGQVGLGLGAEYAAVAYVPKRIGSDTDWAKVIAGTNHSCGLKTDGSLYCWGLNYRGQVGVVTPDRNRNGVVGDDNEYSPVSVSVSDKWVAVAAGEEHTCAIKNASGYPIYCWGRNPFGQLGNGYAGSDEDEFEPRKVLGTNKWAFVAAGGDHTCAINRDVRNLYCWGRDNFGQLGNGHDVTEDMTAPHEVSGEGEWRSVSAGRFNTCGIKTDGFLYCWGDDNYGQLGDGDTLTDVCNAPRKIMESVKWDSVSAGNAFACGVTQDNKLYCWGNNSEGQLGINSTVDQTVPTEVTLALSRVPRSDRDYGAPIPIR